MSRPDGSCHTRGRTFSATRKPPMSEALQPAKPSNCIRDIVEKNKRMKKGR